MTRLAQGLNHKLSRIGIPGVIGIGLCLFSLGIYRSAVVPARDEANALESRIASAAPVAVAARPKDGSLGALADFYAFFPPRSALPDCLAGIYALAEKQGLDVAKAEYRLLPTEGRLEIYQMVLPLKGSYRQVRRFVTSVLDEIPYAAVADLRIEKERAEDALVDSKIKLALYLRTS